VFGALRVHELIRTSDALFERLRSEIRVPLPDEDHRVDRAWKRVHA
jgi:hypothetical protein